MTSESVERSHGRDERTRRRSITLVVFVAGCSFMVAAAGLFVFARANRPSGEGEARDPITAEAMWSAGSRSAPDFTLANQDSQLVSLASLHGRTVLLTFLDSRCTQICLLEGPTLGRVQRTEPAGNRPLIVVVSVNPQDTPASVRAMAEAWQWEPGAWQWLMGSTDELAGVWSAYGVDVQFTPEGLLHTGALYVVDTDGYTRAGFASPLDAERVTRIVRSLSDR